MRSCGRKQQQMEKWTRPTNPRKNKFGHCKDKKMQLGNDDFVDAILKGHRMLRCLLADRRMSIQNAYASSPRHF